MLARRLGKRFDNKRSGRYYYVIQNKEVFQMNIKDFAEKLIKATVEAMVNGNVDLLEKLEDSQVVYHMPGGKDRLGYEAHKRDILVLKSAISNLKMDMKYIAGEGNVFALSFKSTGRFVSEIPTRPLPVGKNFLDDYLFFYRLNKNMIVEVWINGTTIIVDS
jgi:hypothetical protein